MIENRDSTTAVANDLRKSHSPGYIMEELYKKAAGTGENSIIESVRAIGEVETLKKLAPNFFLFAVDAEAKIRYERIKKRAGITDAVTFEKFLADEARESNNTETWKGNLPACIALADFLFINNDSKEDLERHVVAAMEKIGVWFDRIRAQGSMGKDSKRRKDGPTWRQKKLFQYRCQNFSARA